ncbi:MAG: DUF1592 domain-containing protein [Nannocystaceae bacterium]|nr:DUF1592 domain-containing protein [Nannocystaceae bacterium]
MTTRFMMLGAAASLWGLTACYSGFEADAHGFGSGADGVTDGNGTDGNGGGDSDDDVDPDDPASLCMDAEVGPTSLRRLTAAQYDHTIRDLLGLDGGYTADFSPDERIGAFKSNGNAAVVELQVEQYMTAAEAVALDATNDLAQLLPCDAAEGDACAEVFLADFAMQAYRRPLEPGELDRVLSVYLSGKDAAEGDVQNGLRVAIAAVLQSPFFLYHVEFGEPQGAGDLVALEGYELASRLSYFLWDSMPDEALFDAAGAGALADADGVREQVDRMLSSPKARDTIASFHQQWLGVDELEHAEKDPEMFPGYDSTLADSMKEDVASFAEWVMAEGDGRLSTLLTANITLTDDPRLHAVYGITPPAGRAPGEPIELPEGERAGLLTMPAVMAEHAHPDQTSPIHRGVMLRQDFFCQQLPPPPADVDNVPPSPSPDATTRERFAQHTSDPACSGCHVQIDPLGFGLESYDSIGAFRTEETNGLPIDNAGEIVLSDVDGPFVGGPELAALLAQSEFVGTCFSRQWFRYALGRVESDADSCAVEGISKAFNESDQDVRVLLREIALSSAFRFRKDAA